MIEEWKKIDGTNDFYEISNFGNVRSVDRKVKRSDGFFTSIEGKALKKSKSKKGYPVCRIKINSKSKNVPIHRLVALHFVDGDKSLQVNHIDGDKDNNRFDNLEWVTCKENIRHSWNNGMHDLTKRRIPVFALVDDDLFYFDSMKECASVFGISSGRVSESCSNKREYSKRVKFELAYETST